MTSFTDLACSNFLKIPSNLDSVRLKEFVEKQNFDSKTKLIFNEYNPDFIEQTILTLNPKLNVKPYNSNFFILDRRQAKEFLNQELLEGFTVFEIDEKDKENLEIIKNLLTSSFAVKIYKDENGKTIFEEKPERAEEVLINFENNYKQTGLKTFLVKSKLGEIVGCFSLIRIANEVQLSGVAGRTTLPNSYTGKKLVILCQAMISSFLKSTDFEDVQFLTLSNSKTPVAQIYAELGIPKNTTRKGLLVKPI